jgi:hypothetical protein
MVFFFLVLEEPNKREKEKEKGVIVREKNRMYCDFGF